MLGCSALDDGQVTSDTVSTWVAIAGDANADGVVDIFDAVSPAATGSVERHSRVVFQGCNSTWCSD